MQEIATYFNDNFNRFQTAKRSFINPDLETIAYEQLQIVTGTGNSERVYDIKLARDSKILVRADSERADKQIHVQ